METKKIKRALISVSDKTGLLDLARALKEANVEILSTGGTAKLLADNGVPVVKISDHTGQPEIMDGRVKSLHPKIHGGLLGVRDNPSHMADMEKHGITPIDLVCVNLYPFEQTAAKAGVGDDEVIENIDIGGSSMIRSAAKNHRDVVVLTDSADYKEIIKAVQSGAGATYEQRRRLAQKAFTRTAAYDRAISDYFTGAKGEESLKLDLCKAQSLRYGENPHQTASFYTAGDDLIYTGANQLHGKELSYNNILDISAALGLAREFSEQCAVIIKHTNPCGMATDKDQLAAYKKAYECDTVSAFGSVLSFNTTLTAKTAEEIGKTFVEAVVAPDFEEKAVEILKQKKNIRIIKPKNFWLADGLQLRTVTGGLLAQSPDGILLNESDLKVVSKRQPTPVEMADMRFAYAVAKHVKSNAIIYARDGRAFGIGAGQMSRVDSSKIAIIKAQGPVKGCVMASDAFFPFRDGIDAAGKEGITAVISPGGSVRDDEVIKAADEYGMAMVFTGVRHFRH
ncbi:MAG: bifunctional phosphoribosylaminoimidazolecarboxamide formyltransferase/IMP cyclohydrolase [Nitrospinae bacterium]|nr:bifunctional phosphoribosylaminoimidazolecarboxamide formyltransferase/IMP cyclohydrolase [Nitrospinota bacterium]